MKYNILYVDDEQNNIVVFKTAFFRYYNIFTAISGEEGLKVINNHPIHLVITDQKMAGMTGVEFLENIVQEHPDTIRMILTAYSDVDFIMRAINNCGIYQYILKPWDARELKIIIDNALEAYQLKINNQQLITDLKNANDLLELKVKQRTLDLNEKNLRLQKTNQVKDKLFTIISHDLRIPMASLGVLMEVMMQTHSTISFEEFQKYSIKVQAYIQNVIDLLDNLLNWSLSQLGDKTVEISVLNINKIIQGTLKLVNVAAKQKNIEISISDFSPKLEAQGDSNMLHLVLRNLLSNAIKFTHANGRIDINVIEEKSTIKVEIMDSGIGMSDQQLQNLLEPGYFNTKTGTAHEKGTGIGLKLCAEFIEKLGGQLEIITELGKGSTFSFLLSK